MENAFLAKGVKPQTVKLMTEMYHAFNDGLINPSNHGSTTLEEFSKVFATAFQSQEK